MRNATIVILLGLLLAPISVVPAQDSPEPEAEATTADKPGSEMTKKERKQQAKEDRIAAYLKRKEERRARKEQRRMAEEQESDLALELERQQIAEEQSGSAAPEGGGFGEPIMPPLPKKVVQAQAAVRETEMGSNPTIAGYLDIIDRRRASPRQIAAFANFLAENGANRVAVSYYEYALDVEKDDAVLWTNVGTLYRQTGEMGQAASAYRKAISLSAVNAMAHYNLGAVLDQQGKYKKAIEEYRVALTLDPALGDPKVNPQAAHNPRLLAVKTLIYHEQIGSLGLPLSAVTAGGLESAKPRTE